MTLTNAIALLLVLLFALVVQSADWVVGDIVNMAPNPVDARKQIKPNVAFDGDSIYLVVWQQGQNTIGIRPGDIFAARIDIHGTLLDNMPLVICNEASVQESPRVAYNGHNFLVVWSDLRNNQQWDIYGMRVSITGQKLDVDNGFVVAGGDSACQNTPFVIADGDSAFLVAYQLAFAPPNSYYRAALSRVRNDGSIYSFGAMPNKSGDSRGVNIDGGSIVMAHFGDVYMLSVNDHKNAPTGSSRWRGQRIYFSISGSTLTVASRGQACQALVDVVDNCAIATDGETSAFLCSAIIESPRGGAHYGFPCAQFFTLTSTASGAANPNEDDISGTNKPQVTGWNPSLHKTNFMPYANSGTMSLKMDYYTAAGYSRGTYIMLGRRGGTGVTLEQMKSVVISRKINRSGVELGDNFEYARPYIIDDPCLAPSPEGYLLVASERYSSTASRITAQFIKDTAKDSGYVPSEVSVSGATALSLSANPNPFNPNVTIQYAGLSHRATLSILDIDGRVVGHFPLNRGVSGVRGEIVWNATAHSSGVYLLLLEDGGRTLKQKITLVR